MEPTSVMPWLGFASLAISLMTVALHFLNRRDHASQSQIAIMREDFNSKLQTAQATANLAQQQAIKSQTQVIALRTELAQMELRATRDLAAYTTREHFAQILDASLEPLVEHMRKTEQFMSEVYRHGVFDRRDNR